MSSSSIRFIFVSIVVLNVKCIRFGWFGFNAGSTLSLSGGNDVKAARCMCTTVVSAAFGGLSAFAMGTLRNGRYDICSFANGILSGLVGITAGCSGLNLFCSMLTGIFSGIVYDLGVRMELALQVDDPVGAFPSTNSFSW